MQAPLKSVLALVLAATVAAGLSGCVGGTVRLPDTDMAGPRLLVIAPHPDDETVGAGGAIATARERGWTVTVVYVTSGDGFWQAVRKRGGPFPDAAQMQAYGERRVAEARRATTRLGVPAKDVIFLGFPDGAESELWGAHWDTSDPFRATNGAQSVPYRFALEPGAPYSGSSVESALERVIRATRPTTVLMPDPADVNRDHWAVAAFTQSALLRTGFSGLGLTYLVHRTGFPAEPGLHPALALTPPSVLASGPTRWFSLPLGNREVQAQKAALDEHKTQLRADSRLVESFVRSNSLLGLDAPSSSGTGTVTFRQAQDRVYRAATPSTTIDRVELIRGDASATVTAKLDAVPDPSAHYVFRVRTISPHGQWRFWSAAVVDGRLTPLRDSSLSVSEPGTLAGAGATAISVRVPAEAFAGASWAFVGVDVLTGRQYDDHSELQLIRLLPD